MGDSRTRKRGAEAYKDTRDEGIEKERREDEFGVHCLYCQWKKTHTKGDVRVEEGRCAFRRLQFQIC